MPVVILVIHRFGANGMQPAALAARNIGVMQQAASAVCIIFKYLNAVGQHFACHLKWRHSVRSIPYASRVVWYTRNFCETCF